MSEKLKRTFFPKSDLILIDLDEDDGKTETGIIVPGSNRFASGIVRGAGPKTDVSRGRRIIFERANLLVVEFDGDKFHLVRDCNVLGDVAG